MTIAVISMIRDTWGGSEELWYDMAKTALKDGHTVIHLSYDSKPMHAKMKELINLGLIAYQRPGYIKPGSGKLSRFVQIGLNFLKKKLNDPFKKVFKHHPDKIIYNGTCYSIAVEKRLMQIIAKTRVDFYIIGHFNPKPVHGFTQAQINFIRAAFQRAKKVFFISENGKQTAAQDLGYAIINGIVIRNPVNITDISVIPYPSVTYPIQFAMVGNLVTVHKGQDIVLNILKQPQWQSRNWQMNIYGSGSDETYLKQLCAGNHIENRVTFHGRVHDIRAIWKANHILLLPSHMEGMPLVIVEAMLCGRPCVATNVGGITEWLEEDRSGFIAAKVNKTSFATAMEKAWAAQTAWESMGIYAHDRAAALYDPDAGKTLLKNIQSDII